MQVRPLEADADTEAETETKAKANAGSSSVLHPILALHAGGLPATVGVVVAGVVFAGTGIVVVVEGV